MDPRCAALAPHPAVSPTAPLMPLRRGVFMMMGFVVGVNRNIYKSGSSIIFGI